MVLYIILAIIVIILIAVGVLFYLRSNKRQIIEKAIERKMKLRRYLLIKTLHNYLS